MRAVISAACAAMAVSPSQGQDVCGPPLELADPLSEVVVFPGHDRPSGGGFIRTRDWLMYEVSCARHPIERVTWWAADFDPTSWEGTADVAIWTSEEVLSGCADRDTAAVLIEDVPNTREPVLDDNGRQIVLPRGGGGQLWAYEIELDGVLPPDESFFIGVRNNVMPWPHASQIVLGPPPTSGLSEAWYQNRFRGDDFDGDGDVDFIECATPFDALFGQLFGIGPRTPLIQLTTRRVCPADIDGDGDTDAEDFFMFLDLFAAGDPEADIDADGDTDADDFFAFLDLFADGCD